MSGQSSGQTGRSSTLSSASASSSLTSNEPLLMNGSKDNPSSRGQRTSADAFLDDPIDAKVASNEDSHRRHRSRHSGGFLLQSSNASTTYPNIAIRHGPQDQRDVKGKRRAEDGDLIIPKRASARQRHLQKPSLGGSPLATEVQSTHAADHTDPHERGEVRDGGLTASNARHSLSSSAGSNATSTNSRYSRDQPSPQPRNSVLGNQAETTQIVNLALNLSESRRRNFSGALQLPQEAVGGRRIGSLGTPHLGISTSTAGGSLRQHLQEQRQISRNHSPRSGRSISSKADSPHFSHQERSNTRRASALPDLRAGVEENVVLDASDATLARAEKARVTLELGYEYRRLLQYLPKLPLLPPDNQHTSKDKESAYASNDPLGRDYNPVQYIRNRRVRFSQKRPLDSQGQGWNDVDHVRDWITTVANEREDGLSRIDKRFPLPPFDLSQRGLAISDALPEPDMSRIADSQGKTTIARPQLVWEFKPWDLLADAYWLIQDDNVKHIEDRHGRKILDQSTLSKFNQPRTSKESARSVARRSESVARAGDSPIKNQASLASFRGESKERGRRRKETREHGSPISDGEGSRDRKSRWPRRFVRSSSPPSSGEHHKNKRRDPARGHDPRSRDDYDNAALEKHMKEMLAKEAEDGDATAKDASNLVDQVSGSDMRPAHDGLSNGAIPQPSKQRPSGLHRMRTDMPPSERYHISPRASLDEQRFHHHRMSSEDFDSTAPNSPTTSGFIPSIAINLSPPGSSPDTVPSSKKRLPAKLKPVLRDRSLSVGQRDLSENDFEGVSNYSADISRQTTNESQLLYALRKERTAEPQQSLLTPIKSNDNSRRSHNQTNHSVRSIKDLNNTSDSKLRGLFRGGRIAELVGNEVSRVGDKLWKKDNASTTQTNSPTASSFASEDSDTDDGDSIVVDGSPMEGASRTVSGDREVETKIPQQSPKSDKPKYYMDNLPSFRKPFNRDEQMSDSMKNVSNHDPIARQQFALRERGRSTRFDRLAPPKIDMRGISPSPSRTTSPSDPKTENKDSRQSSSSRSGRQSGDAEMKLNDVLDIPGRVGTGGLVPTGLFGLASHPGGSEKRPVVGDRRQWSIAERSVSTGRGSITKRDIARVRALLLSSGVKANEIVRRAEEVSDRPSRFFRLLKKEYGMELPQIPRNQEYIFAGRSLVARVEKSNQHLGDAARDFSHHTVDGLHDQIKAINDLVTHELTPLVRSAADDADAFSTELTTTHTLSVKQLNDSVDTILRKRRRRLRWIRRVGWASLEWTLLGVMWMVWFIVVIIRSVRGILGGIAMALGWLLWLR